MSKLPVREKPRRRKFCYVGPPAIFKLEQACWQLNQAFDEEGFGCYLVGSCLERPDFRDVDVRMILKDEEFWREFPDVHSLDNASWEHDPKWLIMSWRSGAGFANKPAFQSIFSSSHNRLPTSGTITSGTRSASVTSPAERIAKINNGACPRRKRSRSFSPSWRAVTKRQCPVPGAAVPSMGVSLPDLPGCSERGGRAFLRFGLNFFERSHLTDS